MQGTLSSQSLGAAQRQQAASRPSLRARSVMRGSPLLARAPQVRQPWHGLLASGHHQ